MNEFQSLNLRQDQINTNPEDLKVYGKDWTTYFDIKCSAVLFPESTDDVVHIITWARKNKIKLVPSGGRTGLSGAAVASKGEVVVSLEKMNKILELSEIDSTLQVQAGVITESIQNFAQDHGFYYPVDFAARGSSHIGGNIATNAGGIKVVKYGMTRNWITSMKVVTGAGEVLDLNHSLVKNATGPDLQHLFIGSEGTLGIITEVTLRLTKKPEKTQTVLLAVQNLENVMKIFSEFKKKCDVIAFEMFSELALKKVLDGTGLSRPFSNESAFYIVTELEAAFEQNEQQIHSAFESIFENNYCTDGLIAQSEQQAKTFWRYREDISENLARYSPYKNDISVKISKVPDFIKSLDQVLKTNYPDWEVVWFGHIGDGNLHINILRPKDMTKENFLSECQKVDDLLFQKIKDFKGSISAEHGVGLTKKPFLHYSRSKAEIEILKSIKKILDPDLILNPGKIFDL
jgi:glycolate oxidase subunit GlcD